MNHLLAAAARLLPFALAVSLTVDARSQSTWYVDASAPAPGSGTQASPYSSLAFAIGQGTTLSGDTLWVAPGVYVEEVNFLGKGLAIRAIGSPGSAVIRPPFGARAVVAQSGEPVGTLLEGIRITGVDNSESVGPTVQVIGSALELRGCTIEDNRVGSASCCISGAGVYGDAAALLLEDCAVLRNGGTSGFSVFRGAGLYLTGCTTVLRRTTVEDHAGGNGAGLYAEGGTLLVEDSAFRSNRAQNEPGGGLALGAGVVAALSGSIFHANRTVEGYPGGAIHFVGTSLSVADCIFEQNQASVGGAIFSTSAAVTVDRCRFVANRASHDTGFGAGSGGAVASGGVIRRSLFVGNQALGNPFSAGSGVGGALDGNASAIRCTFWDNSAVDGGGAAFGSALSTCVVWNNGSTPLAGGASATWSDVQGGAPGVGNIDVDPQFKASAAGDFTLQLTSPCVDAGAPTLSPDPDGSLADMGALAVNLSAPVSYCMPKVNSAGCTPLIGAVGTPSLTGPDDFHLTCSAVIPGQFGLLIWGRGATNVPYFGGQLCLSQPIIRGQVVAASGAFGAPGCTGALDFHLTQATLQAASIAGFEALFAQWWYRDPGFAPPNAIGLSAGLAFRVLP